MQVAVRSDNCTVKLQLHRFSHQCMMVLVCRVTWCICFFSHVYCIYLSVCVCVCVCLLVSHPAALSYISRGASLLSRLRRWWIDAGWARLSCCPHKAHRCLVRVTPASPCPAVTLSALEIRMCLRSTHSRHPVYTPTHINTHEYTTAHTHISVLMGLSLFSFPPQVMSRYTVFLPGSCNFFQHFHVLMLTMPSDCLTCRLKIFFK